MDLRDVLRVLLRRLWVVIVVTAAAFVTMVAVRYYTKKDQYRATMTFLLRPSIYDSTQVFYEEPQYFISPLSISDRLQRLSGDLADERVRLALEANDPPIVKPAISLTPGADEKSLAVTVEAGTRDDAFNTIAVIQRVYYEFDEQIMNESLDRALKLVEDDLNPATKGSKRSRAISQRQTADRVRAEQLGSKVAIDPEEEAKFGEKQISTLQSSLMQSRISEAEKAHELEAIQRQRRGSQLDVVLGSQPLPAKTLPPPTLETFELYQDLLRLRTELTRVKRRYQEGYDKVEVVRDEIAALQDQIRSVTRGPGLFDELVAVRRIELLKANQEFLDVLLASERNALKVLSEKLKLIRAEETRAVAAEAEVDRLEVRKRDIEERINLSPPTIEVLRQPTVNLATVQFETSTWLMIALVSLVLGVASAYLL